MGTIVKDQPREADEARRTGRLAGHVALVTGGNRGIGAAICRALVSDGAAVAAGYSRNKEQAETFLEELLEKGAEGSIHQGNVGSADDCRRVVGEVIKRHGHLDILVNNAGITSDKPVLKMDDEDWHKVLAVNLSGAFFMSKAALPHMMERGHGRIVNISSIIGQRGNIGQANYAASKSGLFGLTMTLAREAAKQCPDVTVNAVAPGFIETEMLDSVPEKVLDSIRKQIPLGRLGQPDEVARVVHFLCDDASGYVTGQVWAVNGGMEMAGA
jgi:acetoacetyl-CoA reductase/3-oxoacyl-[acyl-carrier protein] reductase